MSTNKHGYNETNPLNNSNYHKEPISGTVDWTNPNLLKIERLRLLSCPGFPYWDVSYCDGRMKDGSKVSVQLPFSQLLKRKPISVQLIEYAKRDGVYAKRLGLFSAISTLN